MKTGTTKMIAKDQMKISNEVTQHLAMRCRLEGIDFFTMSSAVRKLAIIAFQAGVEYWQDKIDEIKKERIEDVPF